MQPRSNSADRNLQHVSRGRVIEFLQIARSAITSRYASGKELTAARKNSFASRCVSASSAGSCELATASSTLSVSS